MGDERRHPGPATISNKTAPTAQKSAVSSYSSYIRASGAMYSLEGESAFNIAKLIPLLPMVSSHADAGECSDWAEVFQFEKRNPNR